MAKHKFTFTAKIVKGEPVILAKNKKVPSKLAQAVLKLRKWHE